MLAPQAQARQASTAEPSEPKSLYWQRERVIADYNVMRSPAEFVKYFMNNRSPEERFQMQKKIMRLGSLPRLERKNHGFTLSKNGQVVNLDMSGVADKKFIVNGHVVFFDPARPLPAQAEALANLLQGGKGKYTLFSLLIPEAEASPMVPIILGALAYVGMGLMNKIIDRYSNNFLEIIDWEMCSRFLATEANDPNANPKFCKDYLREKADLLKKSPENSAVKNALQTTPSKNEAFSTVDERCPQETKTKNYQSMIKILRENPDTKETVEGRVRLLAEFNGNQLKQIRVFEDDYSEGKAKTKTLATYLVDAEAVLTDIVIPNPDAVTDEDAPVIKKVSEKTVRTLTPTGVSEEKAEALIPAEIKISATADLRNDPKLQAAQTYHKSIFAYVGARLGVCKAKSLEEESADKLQSQQSSTSAKKASQSKSKNPR